MQRSRRTEITIEVDRVITVSRRHQAAGLWCSACGEEALMLTPDEATSVSRLSTRAIFKMIDTEQIHFSETTSGLIRLCLTSLVAAAASRESTRPGVAEWLKRDPW
jgi:hypothetical protein